MHVGDRQFPLRGRSAYKGGFPETVSFAHLTNSLVTSGDCTSASLDSRAVVGSKGTDGKGDTRYSAALTV